MALLLRITILAVALLGQPLLAQQGGFGGTASDISAPVEVSADELSVNQKSGQAVFSGNVVIVQDQMRVAADRVEIRYADDNRTRIASLRAAGKVTLVYGADAAEADRAVYEVGAGKVILTGNVLLAQGENLLSGDHVEVDLASGSAKVDGRVRTVLQPGQN